MLSSPLLSIISYSGIFVALYFFVWSVMFSPFASKPFLSIGLVFVTSILGLLKGSFGSFVPAFVMIKIFEHLDLPVTNTVIWTFSAALAAFGIFLSLKVPR
ncbi:hypothetical protein GEMRC1_003855 [Eukaryota sp. GEM-RC1]